MMKRLKTVKVLLWIAFWACTLGIPVKAGEHQSNTAAARKRPPETSSTKSPDSIWNLWNIRKKAIDSYQDTISWSIDLTLGKKATDNLVKALIEFLKSSEGRKFVSQNRTRFLYGKLEDTKDFEENFWKAFDEWLEHSGYDKTFNEHFVTAVNLLPLKPRLNVEVFYPQTPIKTLLRKAIDQIQYQLADDIAKSLPIGNLAPRIAANAVRRASQGGAVLPSVQASYNQYRNQLTHRMLDLIDVLSQKLVEKAVKSRNLDMEVRFTITPWEKTKAFKENPTFPIRSSFYAANEKKAIIPYQVTRFLDDLDNYDFDEEVRKRLRSRP